MFDKGLFGDMFDFNGDGTLDSLEQAADFGMFCELMDEVDEENNYDEEDDEMD